MGITNLVFPVQPKKFGVLKLDYNRNNSGLWETSQDSQTLRSYGNNTTSGFNDPDYRTRIAKRADASHAYKRVTHTDNSKDFFSHSSYWSSGPRQSKRWDYSFCQNILTPITVIPTRTSADDIALKRLKQRLAGDLSQFKTLVPLAELKETRSLVRTTAEATTGLLKALIDIRRRPRDVLSKASKAWLQFSFAISPTISDTIAAVNSIQSYLERGNFSRAYYGRYEERWEDTFGTASTLSACSGFNWKLPVRKASHHYKVQYTAGINFDLLSANNYGLSEHFGLTFGDLPSLGWELIPFSWVVDYFTTAGAFLEDTFSANAGNTFYCTKSQLYTRNASIEPVLDNISPSIYTKVAEVSPVSEATTNIFERTVLSQLPHRAMRFKTADEIGIHSVTKVLNLASVLLSK